MKRLMMLVSLAVGGCAALPPASAPPVSLQVPTGSWRAVEIGGVPALGHVRLHLRPDGLIGASVCNSLSGRYELPAPGRIEIGLLSSTRKLCQPEPLMEQESRFGRLLAQAQSYSYAAGGSMTITTRDGQRMRFYRDAP